MLPPLIRTPRRNAGHHSRERGVTLALVAVAIFSIIAMAGISIDLGTLYEASAEAQRAADAGALAAARVISMSGLTGDPTNATSSWPQICGGASSPATTTAIAVAQQNLVGGAALPSGSVTVTYSASSAAVSSTGNTDCSLLGPGAFGVNPVVTVKVTQSGLPTYFSRIWGRSGNSVSGTATAEAFNPSNSATYSAGSSVVPVQPRCVKPLVVPNYDPNGGTCTMSDCTAFVNSTTGVIQRQGVLADGGGIIGERFWLVPFCNPAGASCAPPLTTSPQANAPGVPGSRSPNLEFLPGQTSFPSIAVPSDGSDPCTAVASAVPANYAQAIAGCDQSTQYQCGKPLQNVIDMSVNPGQANTISAIQCLLHQERVRGGGGPTGQDILLPPGSGPSGYPFQIEVGTNNPLLGSGVGSGDIITGSSSIASLPIYDSSATTTINPSSPTSVTIVGFLQVFIHRVDRFGNLDVTVMNVSGCGNSAPGTALNGSSPVPIRLVTPP